MLQTVLQIIVYTFFLLSCITQHEDNKDFDGRITPGAERLSLYYHELNNKNVALVVNQTSRIGAKHLVDHFQEKNINIKKIFSPEHGFRSDADAGETIENSIDSKIGIPIISLYGKQKKPSAEHLDSIDLIVFDIQDVGVRFYTYISTLHYVMEAAAEQNIPLIVLDRPNPNRHLIDGPVLESEFKSFVGMHKVPVAYGMTIGEYAQMINGEAWLANGNSCDLTIISCVNYDSNSQYILPIKPSPNLPNAISIALYPSLCFFEGTAISVGRGTEHPFQVIGHPEFNNFEFKFTPKATQGAKYPKHQDQQCFGLDLRKNRPRIDRLDLSYLIDFYHLAQKSDLEYFNQNNFINLLAGTDHLRLMIEEGKTEDEIRSSWQKDLEEFKNIRSKYLIYN